MQTSSWRCEKNPIFCPFEGEKGERSLLCNLTCVWASSIQGARLISKSTLKVRRRWTNKKQISCMAAGTMTSWAWLDPEYCSHFICLLQWGLSYYRFLLLPRIIAVEQGGNLHCHVLALAVKDVLPRASVFCLVKPLARGWQLRIFLQLVSVIFTPQTWLRLWYY